MGEIVEAAGYADCAEELDHLVVAYIRHRKMRIITRNEAVWRNICREFTVKWQRMVRGRFAIEAEELYQLQQRSFGIEIVTLSGLLPRLLQICSMHKIKLIVVDAVADTQVSNAIMMPPLEYLSMDSAVVDGLPVLGTLRDWQRSALRLMRYYRYGRFKAATGSGKSTLIAWFCRLAYKSRILVTTSSVGGVLDLHTAIQKQGILAGFITGSKQSNLEARVVCCSTGSLAQVKHLHFDVLVGDEVHEHSGSSARASIWPIAAERIFGFSANQNDRKDNGDLCIEGLYGPLIFARSYQENLAAGDVSPIHVRFYQSRQSGYTNSRQPAQREKVLLTQNHERNKQIASIAKHYYEQGRQVLILVRTTEHCLQIRKHLPEAVAVFRTSQPERWAEFQKMQLIREDDKPGYSIAEMEVIQEQFKARECMLVVANSVWFKGKDFPSLDVVVRGDAMATSVANTQLAGRLSRVHADKTHGLLIDFMDSWDTSLNRRSLNRQRFYKRQGWEILSNDKQ